MGRAGCEFPADETNKQRLSWTALMSDTGGSNENPLEQHLRKIVYVSKTLDPATRLPLVVMDSTAFSIDPDVHHELLPAVIDRLPMTDYTLLFFACGLPAKPSVKLVAKAYSMLKRQARKRVKKIYVVHESWWVRAITDMLRGVVSPKFRRKVVHVSTLSQLAEKVDITLINIPPAVYLHDLKEEDRITIPRHPMPIFAMPLPDIVDRSGIPRFFDDVLDFLGKMAKKQRDIFKGCDDKHLVHVLRDCYDRNQFLSLDDYDPRVVAAVLKLYLYQLPVPLLPVSHISLPIEDTVKFCQRTFSALPYANQVLLSKLCDVMCDLAATTSWNSPGYLSACIAPSLVALSSSSRDGLAIAIRFFRNLLTFWPEISIEPRSKLQTNDHGQDPDRSKIPALTRQKYRNHSTPELRSPRPSIQEHQQRAASSQSMGSQALPYIPPPLKSSSVKRAVDRGTGITAQKPAPPPARGTPTLHQSSAGAYGGVLQITAKVNLPPSGQKPCGITKSPIRTRAPSPPPPRRFGPRLKSVASTKRGKMVAEIARLYEEKCAAAQVLVEMGNQSEDKP